MLDDNFTYDFAISYAGEDIDKAQKIANSLKEFSQDFNVFFAPNEKEKLIGLDGEDFFEKLFSEAKQVIVLISEFYKKKLWTRFEWDIILDRDQENRFIPIRLDNAKIYGLPSNIMYLRYDMNHISELIKTCVKKLILFEKSRGIKRPTEFEKNFKKIKNDSKGSLAKAFQLVKDNRKRTLLEDLPLPNDDYKPSYKEKNEEWYNFSVIRRLSVKIEVPPGLSEDELKFNIKHCAISKFNHYKPDAIRIFASCTESPDTIYMFNAGRVDFAPFGKWEKAEEGFAYNIPSKEFQFEIKICPEYFTE